MTFQTDVQDRTASGSPAACALPSGSAADGARIEVTRFARFLVVGAGGFIVDAGVLFACIHLLALGPIVSRLPSFGLALLFTFSLNNYWTFRNVHAAILRGFLTYVVTQSFGFGCNVAVYTALYYGLPQPWNDPLICLVIASGVALVINYAGARLLVFKRPEEVLPSRLADR